MPDLGFLRGKPARFLAGLIVAQISEFSLIFMAMDVTLGHVRSAALAQARLHRGIERLKGSEAS